MDTNAAANAANTQTANADADTDTDSAVTTGAASEVNARLLAESKKHKALAQEMKSRLAKFEAAEKAALEQQAQFKTLYEQEKAEREKLLKTVVSERIRSTVAEQATKAGCVSVDDLLKLGNRELLQYDESTLEVLGADQFVEDAKKSKPYLFQSAKTQVINPATPGQGMARSTVKPLKELSKEEIMSQLRALK